MAGLHIAALLSHLSHGTATMQQECASCLAKCTAAWPRSYHACCDLLFCTRFWFTPAHMAGTVPVARTGGSAAGLQLGCRPDGDAFLPPEMRHAATQVLCPCHWLGVACSEFRSRQD
jgi:hypothetical protein